MAGCPFSTRRGFLQVGGAIAASAATARSTVAQGNPATDTKADQTSLDAREPFYGAHQGGIQTKQQANTVFAAFDVTTGNVEDLVRVLQAWTAASARLTAGQPAAPLTGDPASPPRDNGEVLGLPPRRLTLTFGFGPGLFEKNGADRFGLRARRPEALADLPAFTGDQLDEKFSGGDLCVQACADDQFVAFHAIRQLASLATVDPYARNEGAQAHGGQGNGKHHGAKPGIATLRWIQTGFIPDSPDGSTPRNLLGFKDGTINPGSPHPAETSGGRSVDAGRFDEVVWADDGPDWMRGGSYMVMRRIRLALEHWDRTELDFQEEVIGRRKASGAPLTGGGEFAPLDLDAVDKDGNPVIAQNAHVRLASTAATGARILRRAYSYNDGLTFIAERWPPWRQGLEYDAGLLFIAYQRDPRTGFTPMFQPMSKLDLLNQYATHIGSALFACPGGVREGEFIGQKLFVGA